ncbi:MAG: MgtC/SapB family protein [Chloroflexota bacterium]
MPADIAEQLDMAVRLILAAVLGAIIGLEREVSAHPAGIRTHLLVSLGSAAFTVLSISAFRLPPAPNGSIPVDPSRVAAQIVTGIGFLGAGAILKYGSTVKGLTTAASLWATAAVGMAAGTGSWLVAVVGALLVVFSLSPLHWFDQRILARTRRELTLRLALTDVERLGQVMAEVGARRIEVIGLQSERVSKNQYEMELRLRLPRGAVPAEVVAAFGAMPGISVVQSDQSAET